MALTQRGDESITVSTTAIGFTTAELTPAIITATVQHVDGGACHFNAAQDPTAGGTEGSQSFEKGQVMEVVGYYDLANVKFILKTGESAATLRVLYFGEGGRA